MAFDKPEFFGSFHLYRNLDGQEVSKYGRKTLVLAEMSGESDDVRSAYLRTLGVLASHGAEVGRKRAIQAENWWPQTVMAQQVFYFPQANYEATIMYSKPGDNEEQNFQGVNLRLDHKTSVQELGPMGEVAIEYDGLAKPPTLRVIDVQGEDKNGDPHSELPTDLLDSLKSALGPQAN